MNIAKKIKELRISNKLTQKQLAQQLGVSQNAVYLWENGLREPNLDMLEKISSVLGVNLYQLLDIEDFNQNDKKNSSGKEKLTAYLHDEYTKEELEEILQFAEYIKSKRDHT